MKPFTKQEAFGVTLILLLTFLITLLNLRVSVRRARDADRRADLGVISDALEKFHSDFGYYPPSENGRIKMCKADNFNEILAEVKSREKFDRDLFFSGLKTCEWGKDPIVDVTDDSYEPYLKSLPSDPKTGEGIRYLYISNTVRLQVYSYLEGIESETGYNKEIVKRQLKCGTKICSFGKSHNVPVDKSIEEYEKELLEKQRGGNS